MYMKNKFGNKNKLTNINTVKKIKERAREKIE